MLQYPGVVSATTNNFWEKFSCLDYPYYLPHVLLNCTSVMAADHNVQISKTQ